MGSLSGGISEEKQFLRVKMSILFPVTSWHTLTEEWKGDVARISAENNKFP